MPLFVARVVVVLSVLLRHPGYNRISSNSLPTLLVDNVKWYRDGIASIQEAHTGPSLSGATIIGLVKEEFVEVRLQIRSDPAIFVVLFVRTNLLFFSFPWAVTPAFKFVCNIVLLHSL